MVVFRFVDKLCALSLEGNLLIDMYHDEHICPEQDLYSETGTFVCQAEVRRYFNDGLDGSSVIMPNDTKHSSS